ncbi:MAG: hypothetical protein IT379_27865, partial [Deltaproteobacteria bacterium]|nr:hypothetical protein [Deltaproteobacteria bacterium]
EPEQRFADVDEFMTGLRIAAAALGDDAASFDPLRSTSGFGLSSSSGVLAAPGRDSLAGSTGSGKAISSPHRTSISDSFPSGSGVTAPRPAEIPRSAPPPVPTSSSGNLRAPLIVGAAIVVAAAVLGLVLSRGWSSDPSSGRGEPHASADDRPRPEPAERPTEPPAASPSQTGSPSLPTPPAPAPHAVAPPATPPAEVTLQLGSVPEADVYEGDARLGSTPVTLPLSPSATTPRTFVLRRAGFRDEEVVVAPTTSSIRREVRLRRETVTSRSTRPSRPSAPAPPASPAPERPRHNPDLDIRTSR